MNGNWAHRYLLAFGIIALSAPLLAMGPNKPPLSLFEPAHGPGHEARGHDCEEGRDGQEIAKKLDLEGAGQKEVGHDPREHKGVGAGVRDQTSAQQPGLPA